MAVDFLESIGLKYLPNHANVIIGSLSVWFVFHYASHLLSAILFPKTYNRLSSKHRSNWHLQFTSFLHAVVIVAMIVPIIFDQTDKYREFKKDALLGYHVDAGNVFAVSLG